MGTTPYRRRRPQRVREAGLDAVSISVPGNWHRHSPDILDLDGSTRPERKPARRVGRDRRRRRDGPARPARRRRGRDRAPPRRPRHARRRHIPRAATGREQPEGEDTTEHRTSGLAGAPCLRAVVALVAATALAACSSSSGWTGSPSTTAARHTTTWRHTLTGPSSTSRSGSSSWRTAARSGAYVRPDLRCRRDDRPGHRRRCRRRRARPPPRHPRRCPLRLVRRDTTCFRDQGNDGPVEDRLGAC